MNTHRNNLYIVAKGKYYPSLNEFIALGFTFLLTVFAWIFFRANSFGHAIQYLAGIFNHPGSFLLLSVYLKYKTILTLITIFLLIEWLGREQQYAIAHLGIKWNKPIRWAFYYSIIFPIFYFAGTGQQFIYFQF